VKNQNSQLLTSFEIGYNLTLILLVIIVFNFSGDIVETSKLILSIIFFMRIFPIDLPAFITIYSNKFANLLIQSTLVIIIYLNKDKFIYNGNGIEFSIFCFIYFNIMRVFGLVYIGKDPIWLGGKSIGRLSKSKGRKNTRVDANWMLIYYILIGIIVLLYANRRWIM
jgi:hypothetical protein